MAPVPHPRHDCGADLVRAVTQANRVDSTHIRLLVAHLRDRRGALEELLDDQVIEDVLRLDPVAEAWTVEALSSGFQGISFHALTFCLGPGPDRSVPPHSGLTRVTPSGTPGPTAFMEGEGWCLHDTIRRPTSVFRGMTPDQYFVELATGDRATPSAMPPLLSVATEVANLAFSLGRPIEYIHAPAAAPNTSAIPEDLTRTGLRFEVAFPRFNETGRLDFGVKLVDLCHRDGHGLWQLSVPRNEHSEGEWLRIVPQGTNSVMPRGDVGRGGRVLAVTCMGPERVGSIHALLGIIADADAELLGLSTLTLESIDILHMLVRTPLPGPDVVEPDERADRAFSEVLGLGPEKWVDDDNLRDYRLMVSPCDERAFDPGLAPLWLSWQAPAARDALRLTVGTLRTALDEAWARHTTPSRVRPRDGHLNLEYLACRNTTSADRLQGRMRVAIDLRAFGTSGVRDLDLAHDHEGVAVSARRLGRFCRDVQHHWRQALSLAIGTPYVDVQVVWHASWLRQPTRPGVQAEPEY